jgi:hypothetical protein
MPIRTMPFDAINVGHIEDLMRREVREDRTLDYKRDLPLTDLTLIRHRRRSR